MKRLRFKILIVMCAVLIGAFVLGIATLAEAEKATVTFYDGNRVISTTQAEVGKVLTLTDEIYSGEDTVYGYGDKQGNIYSLNSDEYTVRKGDVLYILHGCAVSKGEELLSAIEGGATYIKLSEDVSYEGTLTLASGAFYIDTNGYTLSLITDGDAIYGADTGLCILGGGKVIHTYPEVNPNFITNAFLTLSPRAGRDHLFFALCKDTALETDVGLVTITSSIENKDGAFRSYIRGNLKSDMLLRAAGISGATVEIFEGASVDSGCEYFFVNDEAGSAKTYATLYIYGGAFNIDRVTDFFSDESKYRCIIKEGAEAYFSKDISDFFSSGNYTFEKSGESYKFKECNCKGVAIETTDAPCDERVSIRHRCVYCDREYDVLFENGIGHTIVSEKTMDCITTKEETVPGYYTYYCKRCDYKTYEYFYPNPKDVYVTLVVLNDAGEEVEIRVHSQDLYTFDDTTLKSFSTFYVESLKFEELGGKSPLQKNIISVEVPLGTTAIHGQYENDTPSGVFYRNSFIKTLVLPRSIVNVHNYACTNMTALEKIEGIEYITGEIGTDAFSQKHPVKMDYFTVNAKTIRAGAFRNVLAKSITFGANVNEINKGAFGIGEGVSDITAEIIVEGNIIPDKNLKEVFSSIIRKSYDSSNQRFGSTSYVYLDHEFETSDYDSDCKEQGYTSNLCKKCSYEVRTDYKPLLPHSYKEKNVPSTCLVYGYNVNVCELCEYEDESSKRYLATDPNNHVFTYGEYTVCDGYICEDDFYFLGVCECGKRQEDKEEYRRYPTKEEIPEGHEWTRSKDRVDPTCGEYGFEIQICGNCGKERKTQLEPLGPAFHKWPADPVISKAPTCKETGERVFICTVCGEEKATVLSVDTKNGHNWTNEKIILEATETTYGEKQYTCSICSQKKTEKYRIFVEKEGLPIWAIILIVVVSVLLIAGVLLTVFLTLSKKKSKSRGYSYNFNKFK